MFQRHGLTLSLLHRRWEKTIFLNKKNVSATWKCMSTQLNNRKKGQKKNLRNWDKKGLHDTVVGYYIRRRCGESKTSFNGESMENVECARPVTLPSATCLLHVTLIVFSDQWPSVVAFCTLHIWTRHSKFFRLACFHKRKFLSGVKSYLFVFLSF